MSEMNKEVKRLRRLLSELETAYNRVMSDDRLSDKRKSEAENYFTHAINKCKDDIAFLEYWQE